MGIFCFPQACTYIGRQGKTGALFLVDASFVNETSEKDGGGVCCVFHWETNIGSSRYSVMTQDVSYRLPVFEPQ